MTLGGWGAPTPLHKSFIKEKVYIYTHIYIHVYLRGRKIKKHLKKKKNHHLAQIPTFLKWPLFPSQSDKTWARQLSPSS